MLEEHEALSHIHTLVFASVVLHSFGLVPSTSPLTPFLEVFSIQKNLIRPDSDQFTGYETTSGAIARLLNIISTQQDLQARLRAEILKARADSGNAGDLPHDVLMGLPLLDAVTRESLRLCVGFLTFCQFLIFKFQISTGAKY